MSQKVNVVLQLAVDADSLPSGLLFDDWINAAINASRFRGIGEYWVMVRIVDERESQELNRTYRDKHSATNVLAFSGTADEAAYDAVTDSELGDLVICLPVALREADEQGKPVAAHIAHLAVHGTLHLLGYDHADDTEAELMEALETDVLSRLGFSDPYDGGVAIARRQG